MFVDRFEESERVVMAAALVGFLFLIHPIIPLIKVRMSFSM